MGIATGDRCKQEKGEGMHALALLPYAAIIGIVEAISPLADALFMQAQSYILPKPVDERDLQRIRRNTPSLELGFAPRGHMR